MDRINIENLYNLSKREFNSLPRVYQNALVNGSHWLNSLNELSIISDKVVDIELKQKVMSIIRRNK